MNSLLNLIVALFTICFVDFSNAQAAGPCVGTVKGKSYDFTTLMNNAVDYQIQNMQVANPYMIRINMCRALVNLGTPACIAGSAGCQLWDWPTPSHKASLGLSNSMVVDTLQDGGTHKGYTLKFTGGVSYNGGPAQMQINLLCDKSAGVGTPTVTSTANSDFKFDWKTSVACSGGGGGITGGEVFLIILFCGAALYVIVGVIVNRFVRHMNGIEMLPNVAFWGGVFGLIKDGGRFIMLKTCRRGATYQQV